MQFRGKISEKFEVALKKLQAPCKIVFILKNLKTVLLSLKPRINVSLTSLQKAELFTKLRVHVVIKINIYKKKNL